MRLRNHSSLSSTPELVFIGKFWVPLIIFGGSAFLLTDRPRLVEILWPILLGGLFQLSLAQVKAGGTGIRYRRFLKWREVRYEEVVSAGVGGWIFTGYVKLRRFVPPWGKIYFVLDGTFLGQPRAGGQARLTAYINARARGKNHETANSEAVANSRSERRYLGCIAVAFLGIVTALMIPIFFPLRDINQLQQGIPRGFMDFNKALYVPLTWPWGLIVCGLLTLAVVRLRFGTRALVFAFAVGCLLGSFLTRVLV